MPQVQYPFIDIAVHPAVRERFAAGEAIVLFSADMSDVLWANGEGARQFGHSAIYDFLDEGPDRGGIAFRQLAAAAEQLSAIGDRRRLMIRLASGFRSTLVQAEVGLVEIRPGETVVMYTVPVSGASGKPDFRSMLDGFDDPDTHMAVLDGQGAVLSSSAGFAGIGLGPETLRNLAAAARRDDDGLIKRPIPSAAGYLPAAVGKLCDEPPLYLLFCVETVLGRMDPPRAIDEDETDADGMMERKVPGDAEALGALAVIAESAEDAAGDELVDQVFGEVVPEASPEAAQGFETDGSESSGDAPTWEHDETVLSELLMADTAETSFVDETAPDMPEDYLEALVQDVGHAGLPDDASSAPDAVDESAGIAAMVEPGESGAMVAGSEDSAEDSEAGFNPETPSSPETSEPEFAMPMIAAADAAGDAESMASPVENMTLIADEMETSFIDETDTAVLPPEEFLETGMLADAEKALGEDRVTAPDDSAFAAPETVEAEAGHFVFRRDARPVRFVWKLDAEGRFAEVSDEFARTVGPSFGAIGGRAFKDLAREYNLDPDGEIADLLERRDTWSGRTIRWPVDGTDLVVPVDLAALPTYSRNREFDGFRGFGIIRVGDAEENKYRAERAEIPVSVEAVSPQEEIAPAHEELVPLTVDGQFAESADETDFQPEGPALASPGVDEFQGEVPALDIVSNPLSGFNDKIVKLEERRARAKEGLSQTEQAAFREIARQLEPFGKRTEDEAAEVSNDGAQAAEDMWEDGLAGQPADASPAGKEEDIAAGPTLSEVMRAVDETGEELAGEASPVDLDIDDFEPQDENAGVGLTAEALDQIPVALLIHAGDRLIHANTEFARLTGYLGVAALEKAGGLDSLILRKEGEEAGVYMVHADGRHVPVSARLQSVRFDGAKALMLMLTALAPAAVPAKAVSASPRVNDVDARKVTQMEIEIEELRSILETATDGVVVLDADGRIRSMNRSASALFNFDDNEISGKPFAMLFAHESQRAVQDYLAGLSGHGVASVLNDGREVIGREAGGGFILLFMTMGRMPGSNSYCAVIRDITQWKRSEEELKAAKRAAETANQHKSDFLARVSHEIRTPLNAIIGFSDMIASEHFGPAGHSRYVEYAHDIGRSGRHVLDIVNDLLDISKIEAGEMDLEFTAVGLNGCVSEAVSLVQPQANAQRVIIRTSLSQSVPDVVADLRSIKQIAINILANAIRFTPSGGQIVVSTAYEAAGSVVLRIRDTGVGMSKAELEQAMKPFGQVSPGSRQRGDGTGLGLPLTKAMTEANRATFSIHSAPNEGTLVEITFPPQRVLAD